MPLPVLPLLFLLFSAAAEPPAAGSQEPLPGAPPLQNSPAPRLDAVETPRAANRWRVTRLERSGGARTEVRVVAGDGQTPVSVGDGLTDVGLQQRLEARARPPEDRLAMIRETAGRVSVLAAGGGLVAAGVVAVLVGGVLFGLSVALPLALGRQAESAPFNDPILRAVLAEGLFLLLGGGVGVCVGAFTMGVSGVAWGLKLALGQAQAPVDQGAVQSLFWSVAWDEKEAQEVVSRHNAALVTVPAPEAATEAAPESPAVEPAPPAAVVERAAPGSAATPPPPPPPSPGDPGKKKSPRPKSPAPHKGR